MVAYKFNCPECKLSFRAQTSLNNHKKMYHEAVQQKPTVKCKFCDKSYSSQRNLHLHLRTHKEHNESKMESTESPVVANIVEKTEIIEENKVALSLTSSIDIKKEEIEELYPDDFSSDKTNQDKGKELKAVEPANNKTPPPLHYFKKSSTRDPAKKPNNSSLTCAECNLSYSTRSNLKKHVRKFHADLEKAYFVPRKFTYSCKECGHGFTHRRNYTFHAKKHDPSAFADEEIKSKHPKKCPLCDFKHSFSKKMHEHFEQAHNVKVPVKELDFESEADFVEWMKIIENTTNSKFVKKGIDKFKEHKSELYICHRSGDYVPEGKGIRNLKNLGSHKINAFCPASIKLVKYTITGNLKVTYIETHFGHDLDVHHLYLSPKDKQLVAQKIASKIPFKEILNEFKSPTSTSSKRLKLLTQKDLYNIKKSMQLKDSPLNNTIDDTALNTALRDLKLSCGHSVLFYKPRGTTVQEHQNLEANDFVLVIMTPTQCNFLKTYGETCICIDNFSYNDFTIIVLMVIDEFREGFPCAFLISNRSDKVALNILFSQIKVETGPLQTKTFMSDFDEKYFQSWVKVMPLPEQKFINTWHLKSAWQAQLDKVDALNQLKFKKQLQSLIEEENIYIFEICLQQLCDTPFDDLTHAFIEYFKENFLNNFKEWGPCWHAGLDYGTILNLIRSRDIIQHIIKNNYDLDKIIGEFVKHLIDKLFDRLLVTDDERVAIKIKNLKQRHKEMLKLDVDTVKSVNFGWEINNKNEVYFLRQRNITCSCKQYCLECETCTHKYVCSCLDSLTKFNMCKHVHLLIKYRKMFEPLPVSDPLTIPEHVVVVTEQEDVQNILVVDEQNPKETSLPEAEITFVNCNIDEEKQKIVDQFLKHLGNITCVNKLEVVKNMIDSIPAAIEAVDQIEYGKGFTIL